MAYSIQLADSAAFCITNTEFLAEVMSGRCTEEGGRRERRMTGEQQVPRHIQGAALAAPTNSSKNAPVCPSYFRTLSRFRLVTYRLPSDPKRNPCGRSSPPMLDATKSSINVPINPS